MAADLSTPDNKRRPAASSSYVSQSETSPFFNYLDNLSPLELFKFRNKTGVDHHQAFDSPNFATPSPVSTTGQHLQFVNSSTSCEVSELERSSSTLRETPEFDKGVEELECLASKNEVVKVDVAVAEEDHEANLGCISTERLSYDSKRNLRRITRFGGDTDGGEHEWVAVVSELADVLTLDSMCIMEGKEDPGIEEQLNQMVLLDPKEESNFVSNVLQVPREFDDEVRDEVEIGEHQEGSNQVSGAHSKEHRAGRLQNQQKARRRCLIFEMAGGQKRKSQSDDAMASHSALDYKKEDTCLSRKGIGLHLNSHVARSELVKVQSSSSRKSTNLIKAKNAAENSTDVVAEWGDSSSPKRKRLKVVHIKKCSCKKSKCLKLYCECFAAGLYCMESCSCEGCSNNPANEAIVIETRDHILSRNPLAFCPKVVTRFKGETIAATPASARHKKGCNCRKSHCLKKYCECFEGGVDCSPSCGCRECGNVYGSNIVTFPLGKAARGNEVEDPIAEALHRISLRKVIP